MILLAVFIVHHTMHTSQWDIATVVTTYWCMYGSLRYGRTPVPCRGVLRAGGVRAASMRWIWLLRKSRLCSWSQSPRGGPLAESTRMLAFHFLALALPPRRSNSGGVTCCPVGGCGTVCTAQVHSGGVPLHVMRPVAMSSVPVVVPHTKSSWGGRAGGGSGAWWVPASGATVGMPGGTGAS